MTWLKRHGASLALAAVLAVVGGAAVGCSDGGGDDGKGGTGGTAGTDNTGGTGGTGGENPELCNNKVCGGGESCNRAKSPARCECKSNPDSCAEFDPTTMCGSNKLCVDIPPEPEEFTYCDGWDFEDTVSDDGELYCLPLTSGRAIWVRICIDSNDQCQLPDTVCIKEQTNGNLPVCWFNLCDESNTDNDQPSGRKLNGSAFGACDTDTGLINVSRTPRGTCLPETDASGTAWVCRASGNTDIGENCRFDAKRGGEGLCGQGSVCLYTALPKPACSKDEDCDASQICGTSGKCEERPCTADEQCGGEGRYCHSSIKVCVNPGSCFGTCNSGTADFTGTFASCTNEEFGCFGVGATGAAALGYCTGPVCDLFESDCEDGEVCDAAGAVKGNPRGGLCRDGANNTKTLGETCSASEDCVGGLVCVGNQQDGFTCHQLCECQGEGTWNNQGVCTTSSDECAAGEVCGSFGFNAKVGACFEAPAEG